MTENLKVTHYNNEDEIPTGYSKEEWAELETGEHFFVVLIQYCDKLANVQRLVFICKNPDCGSGNRGFEIHQPLT